jgi:hypothetical protein
MCYIANMAHNDDLMFVFYVSQSELASKAARECDPRELVRDLWLSTNKIKGIIGRVLKMLIRYEVDSFRKLQKLMDDGQNLKNFGAKSREWTKRLVRKYEIAISP